jgi:hypothetical protein
MWLLGRLSYLSIFFPTMNMHLLQAVTGRLRIEIMSDAGENSYNLSFLAPVRGLVQPTVFDLERYFPGKLFWKWAVMEKYILGEKELEELSAGGWEIIDHTAASNVLLRLTSQLCLVLAAAASGQQELTLWVKEQDRRHAERCPVVLVYEATQETPLAKLQRMTIGTHAIVFDGEAVFRYEIAQLGEAGHLQLQRIATGVRPAAQSFSIDLRDQRSSTQERTILESLAAPFKQAQAAALQLSELYWNLHQQQIVTPVRLPHTVLEIPPAFRQANLFQQLGNLIPATDGLEAAIRAMSDAHDGARGWGDPAQSPVYLHERATSTTAVTIRMNQLPDKGIDTVAKQLWKRVTTYSDNDGDVLLAMLAQVVAAGPDDRGGTWITTQAILDYRGILPKRHEVEPGVYRDAGHRPEDMREIAASVERLRDMHVSVRTWREPRKPSGRRRRVTQESYLVLISDFLTQTTEGEQTEENPLQIAWYYRPGASLAVPLTRNAKVAWLLQQALRYDPYHEKWEKRLARYFMFQLRINSAFGGATIQRSIREILEESGLFSSIDYTNPERTKVRFDKAMHVLQEHGHVSEWSEAAYIAAMKQRPSRRWLENWLSYTLEITAAPLLEELAGDMLDQVQVQHRLAGPKRQDQRVSRKKGHEQEE